MNRESPGTTGNDRRGTGNNLDCTGNNREQPGRHRSSIGAQTDPGRPTASLVNADRVPV
ncbi:hypothetical protein DPMN_120946 [Dreissena polymorpha]|uniref:Uncharacterized protein n=1 Tax=Dreissena polymorpha TaxID=45954 RepID=A0A9D4ITL4_DREPO|nr:hypothetical protein DPMN_162461 [Dreissena polymorpha]KAH3819212.1 hypothetical protein DPMN_120946 [Dreissena polymorpha]